MPNLARVLFHYTNVWLIIISEDQDAGFVVTSIEKSPVLRFYYC